MLKIETELKDIFGRRVNLKKYERMLYSTDLGVMPSFVRKSIDSLPDAIVLPKNTEEIIKLVTLAGKYNIPLTPRGLGTSGYGGSIPAARGISIVFSQMNKIKKINKKDLTVTVQPGIIWKDLETKLNIEGLDLRLYPSSAPGSTVGGWLAQGGIGIGSFKYGKFSSLVQEVKIVTPQGKQKSLRGKDISLVAESMGTTSLITEITFSIKRKERIYKKLLTFDSLSQIEKFASQAYRKNISFYTFSFINPAMAKAKNKIGKNGESLEEKYNVLISYFENCKENVENFINSLNSGAKISSSSLAEKEWENRFFVMRIKKLGPSLVPVEVIIPKERAGQFYNIVSREIDSGFLSENIYSKDGSLTVLGFILSDERSLSYAATFTASISLIKAAEKLGGKVYSPGMYFNYKSQRSLGDKYDYLLNFKKQADKDNILNPGKLFSTGSLKNNPAKKLNSLMRLAERLEWLYPILRKMVKNRRNGKSETAKIPKDALWYSTLCAKCGYCVQACELYESRLWESSTPRGKWKILNEYQKGNIKLDDEIVKSFLLCTTCKRCDPVCQVEIPILETWDNMREDLVYKKKYPTIPAFEMMASSYRNENNIWAKFKEDRSKWLPEDIEVSPDSSTLYWAGCTASYIAQDIAQNATRILKEGGIDFTILGEEEACCGVPFYMAGKWDVFEKAVRKNIENINKKGINKIIISCPGCWVTLNDMYRKWAKKLGLKFDVELEHITETASKLLGEGKLIPKLNRNETVTYHDPCHIGRHGNIYQQPRDMIASIPGITFKEMEHSKEDALCCGSVLTRAGEPDPTADLIGKMRIEEASSTGAETILTSCPCCEVQLRVSNKEKDLKILDVTDYFIESLGFKSKDSTNDTLQAWEVFDIMINYMTASGMAKIMKDFMADLISAMPKYMKKMMRVINKLPSPLTNLAYSFMPKIMPAMIPKMLPKMMPQVLPKIYKYFKRNIPQMPESMEKLMPKMFPEVMDALMPSMLPKIIPLIMDKMIYELRKGNF